MRRSLCLLGLLLLGVPAFASGLEPAPSDTQSARLARIDQMLRQTYPADEPGAAVLVAKDGKVLLSRGYGMANLELGVPLRPQMVFRIGSITKQFTAVAILKL